MAKWRLIVAYILVAVWMFVIYSMSNEVSTDSTARSDEIVRTIQSIGVSAPADLLTFLVRKAAHISAYFVLGILIYSLLKEYRLHIKHLIIASIALAMLYACTDELHQMFVPGRSGEVRDVLIDSAGAALGATVYAALYSRFYKKSEIV
jgi:VanZ family protein